MNISTLRNNYRAGCMIIIAQGAAVMLSLAATEGEGVASGMSRSE